MSRTIWVVLSVMLLQPLATQANRAAGATGGGTPTIRRSTSCATARATPVPGTPRSAKAIINGR